MSDDLAPGTTLFGYVIERVLGRGGMGTVYLAMQISLNRRVALKVLHQSRVKNPKAADDFFREAAAAARLNHPNLVGVHDLQADTQRGLYAFSMEYISGLTGVQLVAEQGVLPRAKALHLTFQIASALAYAHKQGFVHRDIKPENILIIDGKIAKLLDLGLAYNRLGSVGATTPERHQSSGRKLSIVGTPDYSSPEQSRNPQNATAASDVWSLGATLYFLLTGETPFDGETVIDLIVSTAIDPLEYPPQVTADCRALLELMMAKDVGKRLANGEEVLTALQEIARNERPTLPPRAARETPSVDAHLQFAEAATGEHAPTLPPRRRVRHRHTRR